ncbi:hypothetical protein Mgra_00003364 [Meloidogyne graminicola]|uniref:dCMP deaminase n=1 Tax=Meloidogyne graminicola TaxID=189291 RepID=A0A8S9ZW45_9BILA|nr:hypothetical protein Mgra_00003364 [Meloidogyne graminicola]
MPMPSIVWEYFDEFEGGGKCRLCGCIRNRKDKSTSTFWQHLERVHGLDKHLMLTNNSNNLTMVGDQGKKLKEKINNNKRNFEVNKTFLNEEPLEKMPKLELMSELDLKATEETLKFISDLVNKQTFTQLCNSSNNELIIKNESCSSPIGINLNNFATQNTSIPLNKYESDIFIDFSLIIHYITERLQMEGTFVNEYMGGLIDLNHSLKNGSIHSPLKMKECTKHDITHLNKKRSDYLSWEEFFMGTALIASLRSKDPCTQVGACIIKDNRIVGTGYNGMPNGCNDDDMPWGKDSTDILNTKYLYVCHAEMNAIANGNSAHFKDATICI